MLSRNQFFAQAPATVEPGATCPICLEALQGRYPLRLRCNPDHIYCRDCIRPWATRHRRCTMMCAIRPWDLAPWTNVAPALINQTRTNMLVAPLYTFGVPLGTQGDFITGTFTFSENGIVVPRDGYWVQYLSKRREPDMVGTPMIDLGNENLFPMKGIGLSEPERMFIPIVNLANAIPLLATNSGRPYNATDMKNWRLVATSLVSQIPMNAAVFPEIEHVPANFKAKVREQVAGMGWNVDEISFFQPGPQETDLDLLVEYVAYTMYRECWRSTLHTPAGRAQLIAFCNQRRSEAMQFEQATWMLEDHGRQCEMM